MMRRWTVSWSLIQQQTNVKICQNCHLLQGGWRQFAGGDEVVVLGGVDKDNNPRNDVFLYNSKTGKITALPSMFEKRCACCAVITGDTIVVMGGVDDEGEILSSVECFTMGSSTWEYLPAMNDARGQAVAEVLPSSRKYV